jgi:hypothetical protein
MKTEKDPRAKEGMRIKIISMYDDPNPVQSGTEGTIKFIDGMGNIHVKWDNGRVLGVIPGVDEYQLLESNMVPKAAPVPKVKITGPKGKPSKTPEIKVKEGKKEVKTNKNPKDKKVKTETTAAAGGASTGAYVGPMGATKPMWGKGPLTTKKGIKETTLSRESNIDDTTEEAWADKNNDGWWWNDNPVIDGGKIVDPLAKMKTTWDDDNLDISKEWDKVQTLKKEDLFRLVKNRINEAKKDKKPNKKKEKEDIEETTTFGSALGSGSPVVPAFAAKQGQWRASKKTIYPGGKIVQKIDNSGILNPVNEANAVKYNPGGKFVKVKKKCTKFPYCNQGAIDNPLDVSDKIKGDGNYVEEQLMRNIHEVAMETGKTFDEVYKIVKNNLDK